MAEQSPHDRKSQLIAELERSRSEIGLSVRSLRRDLDVGAHLREAFVKRKAVWLSGAAITGWLISRIPPRKVKLAPPSPEEKRGATTWKDIQRGFFLAVLSFLGTLVRPALTAFASHKLTEYVTRNGHAAAPPPYARR